MAILFSLSLLQTVGNSDADESGCSGGFLDVAFGQHDRVCTEILPHVAPGQDDVRSNVQQCCSIASMMVYGTVYNGGDEESAHYKN